MRSHYSALFTCSSIHPHALSTAAMLFHYKYQHSTGIVLGSGLTNVMCISGVAARKVPQRTCPRQRLGSHALTTTFPTLQNTLAGGGGGQRRDFPTKLSVQVSSASSAAVHLCDHVPQALTSLLPNAADCPTKSFVWVSSASSATVCTRARVP